jgi:CHAT domain-containing protein
MKYWSLLLTLVFFSTLPAQKNKRQEFEDWYNQAKTLYQLDEPTPQSDSTALALFLQVAGIASNSSQHLLAVECLIKAGNIHQTYQRFTESNQLYHDAININRSTLNDPALLYEAYLYIGSSCYFSNIIDSAQYYFEAASDLAYKNSRLLLPEKERLYNSLGAIYFESANYVQAKNYFEKALREISTSSEEYDDSYVSIRSNVANCLLRLNQPDPALEEYKLLLQYKAVKDEPSKEVKDVIIQNTAHAYFEKGSYDSALYYYSLAPGISNLSRIKALNDMGRIYMNRSQWQMSEKIFDSAITVNKKISANIRNKEEALAYLYRGQLAARQGLLEEAITWCNEALSEIHLDFTWKNPIDLPGEVSKTVSPITLFDILRTKAALLYQKSQSQKNRATLAASLKTYRKAIETANYIKLNFDNDEAKLFFNRNYQTIYTEAVETAYTTCRDDETYLDDYVFILENYKGRVLYQNLQTTEIKSKVSVPDSVRRREQDIKRLLAVYTSRINNNAAENEVGQLQNKLLELQVELSRLQKQYEQDIAYNLYRYESGTPGNDLEMLRKKLDHKTALINYYLSDSSIYLMALSRDRAHVEKMPLDSLFKKDMQSFFRETYNYTEGRRYEGFQALANLHRQLIVPIKKVTDPCSRWVIIPDGILYYLPFEALINDPNNREYLVQSKMISYHYSFALLLQNTPVNQVGSGNLAMAPFADKTLKPVNELPVLPYSGAEVEGLGKNIFLSAAATKERFMQEAEKYSLIHLATHASIGTDSTSNWIQFYQGNDSNTISSRLFIPEIYNLNLTKTQLVVLSACETAGGITSSGEGLLSLSRAFIYAGSNGIVSTLWKTEDRITAYIMQQMHLYRQQGSSNEEALQKAKMDLLKNREFGSQYKTPNYWSNFIYVGQIETRPGSGSAGWKWWVGGGALCGLIFYFNRRRRRNKK